MFPRRFPRPGPRALTKLLLTFAFVFAGWFTAEAAGTFVSAPNRVDMVYDSARDTLYITSGGSVLRYQLSSNTFLAPFNLGGSLKGLDLSPDGDTLVVADSTRDTSNVWVWVVDLRTGTPGKALFPRASGEGGTYSVAYGSDNKVLVAGTYEGSGWVPLRQFDPATGAWRDLKPLFTDFFGQVRNNTMLAASGDRSVVGWAEPDASDGPLGRFRVSDSNVLHRTGYTDGTSAYNYEVGVNKNGTQYAFPTYKGTLIYNSNVLKTGTVIGTYAGAQPVGVVYHPVEDIVYFPWTTTTQVRAFDTNTFAQVAAYDFQDNFTSNGNWTFQQGHMKMSRDGSLLFCSVTGGVRFVRLYAPLAAAGQSVTTLENTPAAVTLSGSVGNGGALSYKVAAQPAHGTVSLDGANLVYTPASNYEGADSFTFKSVYGPAESAAATVTVTVTHGNDAPTADDQSVSVDEDGSVAVTVTGSDPDSTLLMYALADRPAYGTLSGSVPNLVYTPARDFYGSDSFTFTVTDGTGAAGPGVTAVGHVYVTVNGVNDPPAVTNQSLSTDEDTAVPVTLAGADIDSSPLNFMVFAPPQHGTLSGSMPNLTYTPFANYNGPDSFGFKATDGAADSNDATMTINVRPVNDAPAADPQSVAASEDTPAAVTLRGSDPEGDALGFSVVTQPAHGTLSGSAPNLVYTPAPDYNGADSFTFRVSDGAASSAPAAVSVSVAPVNDAPAASGLSVTTKEDTTAAFTLNGSDLDGDEIGFVVVSGPAHGSLTGSATGAGPNFTYTPFADYNGPDSFTFKVSDRQAESNVATVSINVTPVNDLPAAPDMSVTTDEDKSLPVALNVTDADGDTLTYYFMSYPSHGSIAGAAPNLTYNPETNYNGTDTFSYRVYDGTGTTTTATVTITIKPVEDAPVAVSRNWAGTEDTPLPLTLSGADADGDALTYAVVTQPAHGTLSGTAPNLTYTPAANYNGWDSFTFKASDGKGESAPESIYVSLAPVNDAPTSVSQSYTVTEDSPRQAALYGYDADNNAITYQVVTQPAHGTLSGTDWNLTYAPAPNYNGPDSFTFKVNDGTVDSAPATIYLNVTAVNDAPAANGQTVATNEDTSKALTLTGSDVDGDALTYRLVTAPQHGSVTGGVPNLTYTPAPNYNGPDGFTFAVFDGWVQSATATVSINVAAVNDAPAAAADSFTVVKNSSAVSLAVLSNDTDVDGDALTITAVTQPPNGTVTIAAGGKSVTYKPRQNFRGTDAFNYTVSDGRGGTTTTSVNITVK